MKNCDPASRQMVRSWPEITLSKPGSAVTWERGGFSIPRSLCRLLRSERLRPVPEQEGLRRAARQLRADHRRVRLPVRGRWFAV